MLSEMAKKSAKVWAALQNASSWEEEIEAEIEFEELREEAEAWYNSEYAKSFDRPEVTWREAGRQAKKFMEKTGLLVDRYQIKLAMQKTGGTVEVMGRLFFPSGTELSKRIKL